MGMAMAFHVSNSCAPDHLAGEVRWILAPNTPDPKYSCDDAKLFYVCASRAMKWVRIEVIGNEKFLIYLWR